MTERANEFSMTKAGILQVETPRILPANVNAFNTAAAGNVAGGVGLQQALNPEEPIMLSSLAQTQDSVMNNINAPNALTSAVPMMCQPEQSDIACVSNNAMQMAGEVASAFFGVLSPEPKQDVTLTAEIDERAQVFNRAAPQPAAPGAGASSMGGMG